MLLSFSVAQPFRSWAGTNDISINTQGHLIMTTYARGEPSMEFRQDFDFYQLQEKWYLLLDYKPVKSVSQNDLQLKKLEPAVSGEYFEILTYDGLDSFRVYHTPDGAGSLKDGVSIGYVWTASGQPDLGSKLARFGWLGLTASTSDTFLSTPVTPWYDATEYLSRSFTVKTLRDSTTAIATNIVFVFDSQFNAIELAGRTSVGHEARLTKAFIDGFQAGEFTVVNQSSFNGHPYPSEFQLQWYHPNKNDRFLLASFKGTVTNVLPCNRTEFTPTISRPMEVRDFRIWSSSNRYYSDPVYYELTNAWVSTNDQIVGSRLEWSTMWNRSVREAASKPRLTERKYHWMLAICAAVSFTILISIARILAKTKTRK